MIRTPGRHARPTKARALTAAVGSVAATAALTTGTAGNAVAASSPLSYISDVPEAVIGLIPVASGAVPVAFIAATDDAVETAAKTWNGIPIVGTYVQATGTSTSTGKTTATSEDVLPAGWRIIESTQTTGLAIDGVAGVQNALTGSFGSSSGTYTALLAALADGDLSTIPTIDLGSAVSDTVTLSAFGSGLAFTGSFSSVRDDLVTTFTPQLTISGVGPLANTNPIFTFSPGSFSTGGGTFGVVGPSGSVNLAAFGLDATNFTFATGSIKNTTVTTGTGASKTTSSTWTVTTPSASGSLGTEENNVHAGITLPKDAQGNTKPTLTYEDGNKFGYNSPVLSAGATTGGKSVDGTLNGGSGNLDIGNPPSANVTIPSAEVKSGDDTNSIGGQTISADTNDGVKVTDPAPAAKAAAEENTDTNANPED